MTDPRSEGGGGRVICERGVECWCLPMPEVGLAQEAPSSVLIL